jgi:class 3 adenylate cyclase/tetratricopeptide (TPR) repeat protein
VGLLASNAGKQPASSVSTPGIRIAAGEADTSVATNGERKTVTELLADIKGSMELMEDLDPEEARAIVDPALKLMIDAVHRYDGYIVQSTGDGIFALFGAPVAHEDHPQRALCAALRMQEDLRRYSAKLREGGNLAVEARVGVNTGEVVVRSIRTGESHAEYSPIGYSTSLAARMQALAPTGSIATTEPTRRLCEGYFSFKLLGPTRIKGVSEPVNVLEVIGLGPLRTRLQVSAQRGLTKFVGRHAELEQMKHALELARQGHGQIVAAMGEPGVGKSRLFFEFKAVVRAGCLVLEACSVSHGKASAYLPVIDLLHSYFGIQPADDGRARREKVGGKTLMLERKLEDTLPYLFALLGIVDGDDALAQMDGQLKKRRTLEAIKRLLLRESLSQPLLLIFEDLHWIDEQTQEFLNLLTESIGTARILLLVNYRPEYQHRWGSKTYYTQLRLDPLGGESAEQMLAELLGSEPTVPDQGEGGGMAALKRLIIERTEGVPFFIEEIVQALHEDGMLARNGGVHLTRPLAALSIPVTVQAVLSSRIDRLPAGDKDLLQTLAVLGREFALDLVRRVTVKPADELESMLWRLQAGEFIYEQPGAGDVEYTFKHALTQEVAYNALLGGRRKLLHERAGAALESMLAGRPDDSLPELARHYARSDNVSKAVEYLGRAGFRVMQQAALSEAAGYLSQALELLKQLPANVDRDRQELELRVSLLPTLYLAHGPRVVVGLEAGALRARELCEQLRDDSKLPSVILLMMSIYISRSEFAKARELGESILATAEPASAARQAALQQLGAALYLEGDFEVSRERLAQALGFPDGEIGPTGDLAPSVPGGDVAPSLLPNVLQILGYTAAANRVADDAIGSARRRSDSVSLARVLVSDALRQTLLCDSTKALERAEEAFSIATEHGMTFYQGRASFCRGWAMAHSGQPESGAAEMRRCLSFTYGGGLVPVYAALLAETYGKHGHTEEGFAVMSEGLARVERTGERMAEAELHRVKGELLMMRDAPSLDEAESCFSVALEIARRQKAKWWELRAATCLARLLVAQDKAESARELLTEIYSWFTEGFDTVDLKEARALLDELGA